MSAFKKAHKAVQKPHRERSQPSHRLHMGLLEKKSDYKLRARNFHNKEKQLKILRKKALERNRDEFYHKMIHKKLRDGEHWIDNERPESTMTEAQKKLMESQDLGYVQMRLQMENKKLERLSEMIDFDETPRNRRTIFVDSMKEAKCLKLNITPSITTLKLSVKDKEGREKLKREVQKRKNRRDELRTIVDKMVLQRQLKDSSVRKEKIKKETKDSAAIYKWRTARKR